MRRGGMIAVACKVKFDEGGNPCSTHTYIYTSDTRKSEDSGPFIEFCIYTLPPLSYSTNPLSCPAKQNKPHPTKPSPPPPST